MKSVLIKASLLAAMVAAAGCQTTTTAKAPADPKAAYEAKLAATEAAAKKAASVGGEWRDVRWKKSKSAYMPKAIKAAEAGDYAKAMKLLDTAQFQAEAGYKQAMEQKNAGPRF
jgi:hypothetical protein